MGGGEHVLAGGESSRLRDRGLFVFGVDGTPRQELRFPQARNICAMSLYEGHLYLVEDKDVDKAAEGDEYPEMMLHVHQIMT